MCVAPTRWAIASAMSKAEVTSYSKFLRLLNCELALMTNQGTDILTKVVVIRFYI
jgi:hypothetical protein